MTTILSKWYITIIRPGKNLCSAPPKAPRNADDWAWYLLAGVMYGDKISPSNHAKYLWHFKKTIYSRNIILNKIKVTKLWFQPSGRTFTDFEDLYCYVWNTLNYPKVTFIGQLIIYDISVRLAALWDCSLLPAKKVYVHALPMKAYNELVRKRLLKGLSLNQNIIDMPNISHHFPGLTAWEIEDILCEIGKSIRRVRKRQISSNPKCQRIDKLVKTFL
ncbi:MAG: hypothetical protein J5965_11850 [Aeriscardovia sp.]|nr:hypothetical protein [Aeriscardovia sp.]